MDIALVRPVSAGISHCELSCIERAPIDLARARSQHADYCRILADHGLAVQALPPADELPDAVFVEDTAVVLDEVAVITRPGAESRRPEAAATAEALAAWRDRVWLEAPATLDGGDVIVAGRTIYVGVSARTNDAGRAQLAAAVEPFGYRVRAVPITGCLHLKSAVTLVADGLLLANPRWVDLEAFDGLDHLPVAPDEPHAANSVRLPDAVLMPEAFPRTRTRLEAAGLATCTVAADELARAEGGVSCQSIIFTAAGAGR
jgi:dimethylargininase